MSNPSLQKSRLLALNSEVVECKACPRLVGYRESIARVKKAQFASWSYWGRPVPGFGDIQARVLVIGLAPAPHGGNRTGRLFTGDKSADFLIRALFQAGFANQPGSVDREDGLVLKDAYITAAVKCVPPDNRPTNQEISNCSRFLERELEICNKSRVILCLGQVAFRSTMNVLKELGLFSSRIPDFEHGLRVELADGRKVYGSYHPSPRNTQTGKLTAAMFNALLRRISESLSRPS